MKALLAFSDLIDRLNTMAGKIVMWGVLVSVLISSANATIRYVFDTSSNAWLEMQWYLFAAVFLLCAPYTLLRNEHIRIDVLNSHLSRKAQLWIDILGGLFFLLPMSILIMVLAWPMFADSYAIQEMSTNAGGLIRWPVKLILPVAFLLLTLQGLSEVVKKIAILNGHLPDPGPHGGGHATQQVE